MNKYKTKYKYDIFISYAWVDNEPFFYSGDESFGWVKSFVDTLEKILNMKIGRSNSVDIWMDVRKKPRQLPEILEHVKKSATEVQSSPPLTKGDVGHRHQAKGVKLSLSY